MTTSTGVSVINDKVKKESGVIDAIRFETSKVIVGQSVLRYNVNSFGEITRRKNSVIGCAIVV